MVGFVLLIAFAVLSTLRALCDEKSTESFSTKFINSLIETTYDAADIAITSAKKVMKTVFPQGIKDLKPKDIAVNLFTCYICNKIKPLKILRLIRGMGFA